MQIKTTVRELPGSPVVRTPRFHCQEPGFNPWSGAQCDQEKKEKNHNEILVALACPNGYREKEHK